MPVTRSTREVVLLLEDAARLGDAARDDVRGGEPRRGDAPVVGAEAVTDAGDDREHDLHEQPYGELGVAGHRQDRALHWIAAEPGVAAAGRCGRRLRRFGRRGRHAYSPLLVQAARAGTWRISSFSPSGS